MNERSAHHTSPPFAETLRGKTTVDSRSLGGVPGSPETTSGQDTRRAGSLPLRLPPLRSFGSRLLAICLVALILRAAFIGYVPRHAGYDDSFFYHRAGILVSEGQGYRSPFTGASTAMWPPGYPFVLGGAYKAFGARESTAKWLNVVFGTMSVALLGFAARKHLGERAGLIAASLLAAYPAHIYFTALLMTELLFTFLLVLAYFTLVHLTPSLRSAVLLGAVAGLATLVRGEALVLPVAYGSYWAVQQRSLKRPLLFAIVSGVALAACVAPWTYRNYEVMGAFVPLNTYSSEALWQGHNAGATGFLRPIDAQLQKQLADQLPPKDAEVEFASRQQKAALKFIRDHPLTELRLIPPKLLFFLEGDGVAVGFWFHTPANASALSESQFRALRFISDLYYYCLLAASVVGMLFVWRNRARRDAPFAFLTTLLALWLLMHGWLFFGDPRYHLPLMALLIVPAAAAVDEL